MSAAPTASPLPFGGVNPIFRVASVAYYVEKLGFTLDFKYDGMFASVRRGNCNLFLVEGDQGHPGDRWIRTPDGNHVKVTT